MDAIVQIQDGKIRGCVKSDYNGNNFYSFQGIRYAKPPLGDLRFKAPQPPEKWKGILDATQQGDQCYAKNMGVYIGVEDCLFLNVYTKEIQSDRLKPVMVWIHGGGFTGGSSGTELYGPEYLLMEDIVLVTFNYRVGILGFLCLEDASLGVPGNAGMKDMVMALKWVQANIRKFSGDPGNVTIFGESAGGASVHYLMLSPMSRGLFHKAIAQSSCALNVWTRGKRHAVYLLAEALGIHSTDESVILKQLQNVPVEEFAQGMRNIPDPFYIGRLRPFVPTIERTSLEPSFLSEHPLDIIKSGQYHKVPLIIGCCSKEGMFVYGMMTAAGHNNTEHLLADDSLIPYTMNLRKGSDTYKTVLEKIRKFYFGDKDPMSDKDLIYKVYTENFFLFEVYNTANYHRRTSTTPIYFYKFSLDTQLNFMKTLYQIEESGACHADDFAYLFKNVFTSEIEPNSPEEIGIHRMVKMWTNFAKYGNPTPRSDDPLLPISWKPISETNFNVLEIGEDLKMFSEHPEKESFDFWTDLYQIRDVQCKL